MVSTMQKCISLSLWISGMLNDVFVAGLPLLVSTMFMNSGQ